MIVALLIAEVFVVGFVVAMRLIWLDRATESRYVERKGVPVSEGEWPAIKARLRRSSTFIAVATIGGSLVTSAIAAIVSREGTLESLVAPVSGVIGGAVVGACAWLSSEANRSAAIGDPRRARLTDYISPAYLAIAVAGVLTAVGVLVAAVVIAGRFAYDPTEGYYLAPWTPALPLIAILAGWITLIGTAAIVVRKRQQSTSPWDDALLSHVLTLAIIQLATAQIALAPMWLTAITQFALPLGSARFQSTLLLFAAAVGPLFVAYLVAALVDRKPERQFLRRLWPALAANADEVAAASKQARRDALIARHQARA